LGDLPEQVLATPATQLNQLLTQPESDAADPGWPRCSPPCPLSKTPSATAEPSTRAPPAATPSRSAFIDRSPWQSGPGPAYLTAYHDPAQGGTNPYLSALDSRSCSPLQALRPWLTRKKSTEVPPSAEAASRFDQGPRCARPDGASSLRCGPRLPSAQAKGSMSKSGQHRPRCAARAGRVRRCVRHA
jgi:hypothetical protein